MRRAMMKTKKKEAKPLRPELQPSEEAIPLQALPKESQFRLQSPIRSNRIQTRLFQH
jgi:hypothetical protein